MLILIFKLPQFYIMSSNDDEILDGTNKETLVYSVEVQKAIDEVYAY